MSRQADAGLPTAPYGHLMSDANQPGAIRWLAAAVVGAAAALLLAWLDRLAGVPWRTVLSIGAGAVALIWLIVLVSVPWNLYFAARRVVAQIAVSRRRGILVKDEESAEARSIASRMLWFALGAHLVTAAAAAVISYFSGAALGYYFTGGYLLSAAIRPAVAYLGHLRERIGALSRESLHPREDVAELRAKVSALASTVKELSEQLPQADRALTDELRRAESRLTDDIGHARQALTADLARLQDAHAADQEAARARDENLARRVDQIARRISDTLDGLSDHAELQAGLRALVRMIRTDAGS